MPPPPMAGPAQQAMCPMRVPGVQVEAVDVDGGAALSFAAPSEQVPFLRARVRAMAARMNDRMGPGGPGRGCGCGRGPGGPAGGCGCGHGGGPGPGCGHGGGPEGPEADALAQMAMPPLFAWAEDTEQGARIVLAVGSAADVDWLRVAVRRRVDRMRQMQQMHGAPPPPPH